MASARPPLRTLLVEDEMVIALLVEDLLTDLGHEVADIAARLETALRMARTNEYDLAILDINLDGERSFAIAETLAERGVPTIFASGYGPAALPEAFRATPVLQKPFTAHDLAQAIDVAAPQA